MAAQVGKLHSEDQASFSGIDAKIMLGGDGPLTVLEMTVAPERGAPAHTSNSEDKIFVVKDGRLTFLVGKDRIVAGCCDTVSVPRGVIHSFTAMDGKDARMTLVSAPARHDRFFKAMGNLAEPHDQSEVQAICEKFDQSIVGPVVTAKS